MKNASGVDEYIAGFPQDVGGMLEHLRETILKTAPEAKETISYGIPAYVLNGNLVHFGAKKHIGFYPAPSAIEKFKEELAIYKTSKGAIQLPLENKLPVTLIRKIVKFRMAENLEKRSLNNKSAARTSG